MDAKPKWRFNKDTSKGSTMELRIATLLALTIPMLSSRTGAQTYDTNNVVVQTFAGSGFYGHVDGVGQQTMFNNPALMVADSAGNLFVWDSGNGRIRKITPDGTVTTFAGGGTQTTGVGTNVNLPATGIVGGMAIDHQDTIWMVTYSSSYLYRITSDAVITRSNLSLSSTQGVCVDSSGNIYVSDWGGDRIYRYTTNGVLSIFAGSGNSGHVDGNGIFSSFSTPRALAADAADNIYVWDSGSFLIRRIDQNQNVTTYAGQPGIGEYNFQTTDGIGTNAVISHVNQMTFDDSGNMYLACDSSVRRISASTNVTTLAGNFMQYGYTNGTGNLARFNRARGICVAGGMVFVADDFNHRIRSISFDPSPEPVLPANLKLNTYPGLEITGTVGRTYQIQTSSDMTNWTTRATLVLGSSPHRWIDDNPVGGSNFYRALMLP